MFYIEILGIDVQTEARTALVLASGDTTITTSAPTHRMTGHSQQAAVDWRDSNPPCRMKICLQQFVGVSKTLISRSENVPTVSKSLIRIEFYSDSGQSSVRYLSITRAPDYVQLISRYNSPPE